MPGSCHVQPSGRFQAVHYTGLEMILLSPEGADNCGGQRRDWLPPPASTSSSSRQSERVDARQGLVSISDLGEVSALAFDSRMTPMPESHPTAGWRGQEQREPAAGKGASAWVAVIDLGPVQKAALNHRCRD